MSNGQTETSTNFDQQKFQTDKTRYVSRQTCHIHAIYFAEESAEKIVFSYLERSPM